MVIIATELRIAVATQACEKSSLMTSQKKCYYWSCDCVAMLLPLPPFDNQNRARRMSTIHNFFAAYSFSHLPKPWALL
jgi:hypothetical protein